MLNNSIFYHQILRKLVASFGTLFNNIYVIKRNSSGQELERLKVPVIYGPREKYLIREIEDPDLQRDWAAKFPIMSFEIAAIAYDGSRKLNTLKINTNAIEGKSGTVLSTYQGVPYKVTLNLSIISKYVDEANQIVEQILPWFTPVYTITIAMIPELEIFDDVPFTLTSVNMTDNYEENWLQRRDVIWTLSFESKILFYGPIKPRPVINEIIVDTKIGDPSTLIGEQLTPRVLRYMVTPDPLDANYEMDYGYTETIEQFSDDKKYDPITGTDVTVKLIVTSHSINPPEIPFGIPKMI